jgi:hypothetical protein
MDNDVVFNERVKLRATYLNNIAVGVGVTGVFGPYLALYTKTGDANKAIRDVANGAAGADAEISYFIGLGAAFVAAVFISIILHWWARRTQSNLRV